MYSSNARRIVRRGVLQSVGAVSMCAALRIAGLGVTCLLLSSCLITPINVTHPGGRDASVLPPPSVPLSAFTDFELKPLDATEAVAADADKKQAAALLDAKLKARLSPLFERWHAGADSRQRRVLVIEPLVVRLRIVGAVNRVASGGYARDSFVDLNLYLRDGPDGDSVATARISVSANAATASWTLGAPDRNLLDDIVEVAYRYVSQSYWPGKRQ